MKMFLKCLICFVVVSFIISACGNSNIKKAKDYIDIKMYTEAIEILKSELNNDPKNVEAHYYLGLIYLYLENDKFANESFNRAIFLNLKYKKNVADAYIKVGFQKLNDDKFRNANDLFYKAIEIDSSKKKNIASRLFDEALEIVKSQERVVYAYKYLVLSAEYDKNYQTKIGDFSFEQTKKFLQNNFIDGAIAFSTLCNQMTPQYKEKIIKLYDEYIEYKISEGNFEQVETIIKDTGFMYDDTVSVKKIAGKLYKKSMEYGKNEEHEKAQKAFILALVLNPDYEEESYKQLKNVNSIMLDMATITILMDKAAQYGNEKHWEKSIKIYRLVEKSQVSRFDAAKSLFMIGYICSSEIKDIQRAEKAYLEFLEHYSDVDPAMTASAKFELKYLGKDISEIPFLEMRQ